MLAVGTLIGWNPSGTKTSSFSKSMSSNAPSVGRVRSKSGRLEVEPLGWLLGGRGLEVPTISDGEKASHIRMLEVKDALEVMDALEVKDVLDGAGDNPVLLERSVSVAPFCGSLLNKELDELLLILLSKDGAEVQEFISR